MRADAVASITRILDAARHVFASGDGTGTLDRIAGEAGVGIATLYRHFPNRQSLARAVYEHVFSSEIEPLLERLEGGAAPHDALLDVAEGVVEVARRERGLVAALGSLGAATQELLAGHRAQFDDLVARGQAAGNLRDDLTGADVPHLLALFASGGAVLEIDATARRRYLGFMLDGLRPQMTTRAHSVSPTTARSGATSP
jgi:AcrR family transcriptional regulator